MGATGYKPSFFETGNEILFQDFVFDVSKKISSVFSFTLMYANQVYNQKEIEKEAYNGNIVYSNIFISDIKFKLNKKTSIRNELQYLHTKQDKGDWVFGMIECSFYSNLMLSVSDMYNSGVTKLHYPLITSSYTYKSHRIQIGYGRTREGINCSGGVCRVVPASKGWNLSYNYSF